MIYGHSHTNIDTEIGETRKMTFKALQNSIQGCSLFPIDTMPIPKYCKFYGIANETYKA